MPFGALPTELKQRILEYAVEPGPTDSKSVLGFKNPRCEAGPPNIYLTLPLKTPLSLYRSNPAGVGRGRFVRPSVFPFVSKSWKIDVEDVWGRTLVTVGVSLFISLLL